MQADECALKIYFVAVSDFCLSLIVILRFKMYKVALWRALKCKQGNVFQQPCYLLTLDSSFLRLSQTVVEKIRSQSVYFGPNLYKLGTIVVLSEVIRIFPQNCSARWSCCLRNKWVNVFIMTNKLREVWQSRGIWNLLF